ncbi:MAG: hypothetical protein AAF558_13075 [Verrucomicrobiota bacterium]
MKILIPLILLAGMAFCFTGCYAHHGHYYSGHGSYHHGYHGHGHNHCY